MGLFPAHRHYLGGSGGHGAGSLGLTGTGIDGKVVTSLIRPQAQDVTHGIISSPSAFIGGSGGGRSGILEIARAHRHSTTGIYFID